ncbi:D-hexose-6-phosphate mutarotase [Raineyella fluvialis]|uniref:Putative glucose-6-phosphate 1-epimerase n=1 Tax=Raineyella fluvialis TaxID=2662261 RepID=A0A5Q2FEW1_9ACTN|nr:D-hexose-6-phosphate mutarotase [Raineyella fluvialis]QGF23623.1 D-hexose-6-phosphate mutarotase [Raineyella fluvialis]
MENSELPDGVTLEQGEGGQPVVRVAIGSCTAEVYLHGGHLTGWQPTGQEPVIWLSGMSRFEDGAAIRGGVPICFPWFGSGTDGQHYPPHGVARLTRWALVEATPVADSIRLRLHLDGHDVDLAGLEDFDRDWAADITYTVGQVLDIDLRVEAYGNRSTPFTFEEALHTYLHVGDARRITIDGLDGCGYHDKVINGEFDQRGTVVIVGETDRIYQHAGDVVVKDPTLKRTLGINKRGSGQTVIWNPFVSKSAKMGDFGNDEWQEMLCVEAANVGAGAVTLSPGQSHTIHQRIAVDRTQRSGVRRSLA